MKVSELKPGDVFDIVPVLESVDIAPSDDNYYELYEVEGVKQEEHGITVVFSTDGGNWALPSDAEVEKL